VGGGEMRVRDWGSYIAVSREMRERDRGS